MMMSSQWWTSRSLASGSISAHMLRIDCAQGVGFGPAGCPVKQLNRMQEWNPDRVRKLCHAANIAACGNIRLDRAYVCRFTSLQLARDLRLQKVVHSCRTAAHEAVRHLEYLEP